MALKTSSEYILFCDESDQDGPHFKHFFGGLLIGSNDYDAVTQRLEEEKTRLNLFGELKWTKVGESYLPKYEQMISELFEEVRRRDIRIRIMFQPASLASSGSPDLDETEKYFKLYYQFIKHAFHFKDAAFQRRSGIRIYLDEYPSKTHRKEVFKKYLLRLPRQLGRLEIAGTERFRVSPTRWRLSPENITWVNSKDHVLLQSLDIILGAMAFRLKDRHKEKAPNAKIRGKRTRAKEKLYKHIYDEICRIKPNFNIKLSTGLPSGPEKGWSLKYAHWVFKPK